MRHGDLPVSNMPLMNALPIRAAIVSINRNASNAVYRDGKEYAKQGR